MGRFEFGSWNAEWGNIGQKSDERWQKTEGIEVGSWNGVGGNIGHGAWGKG